jgi:hypothetical protein
MPAVVDKASQISLHRKRSAFKKSYHSGKEYLAKFCYHINFPSITPAHRLVYQRSDMPRSGQDKQAIVTRNKRSSESPEPTEHRHSRPKQSSGGSNKSQVRKDQESGQGRRGSHQLQKRSSQSIRSQSPLEGCYRLHKSSQRAFTHQWWKESRRS